MTRQQQGILWIGLIVVLVFLFTDQSFRDKIFNRGTQAVSKTKAPYTTAQIFTAAFTSSGAPAGAPTQVNLV